MNCTVCNGLVNERRVVTLRVSRRKFRDAHPCTQCHLLHWEDGRPAQCASGASAFLEEGQIVHRNAEGGLVDCTMTA